MKVLDEIPLVMKDRSHRESVAILCDCGCTFSWAKTRGTIAECPKCKNTADVSAANAPAVDQGDHEIKDWDAVKRSLAAAQMRFRPERPPSGDK